MYTMCGPVPNPKEAVVMYRVISSLLCWIDQQYFTVGDSALQRFEPGLTLIMPLPRLLSQLDMAHLPYLGDLPT